MSRIIQWSLLGVLAVVPAVAFAQPTTTDKHNAAGECRDLRSGMGVTAFRELYGANKNDKNAFGKCTSKFAREEAAQRKAAHSNAAKDCKAEQDDSDFALNHGGQTFDQFYGDNKNGKNAYGNCVSQKAKANKQEADALDEQQDETTVNSARECRTEQKADPDAFRGQYGTNKHKRNAFGKCVSQKSRAKQES